MIDLHIHTTSSDGTASPSEVVRLAAGCGLSTIAITDHDTMTGIEEAQAEARRFGLEVVAGIELSVEYSGGSMHLLGYFPEGAPEQWRELDRALVALQRSRMQRNQRIITRLHELGMELSYEDVLLQAGGTHVGRPHFAAVLLRKGYVTSMQQAFDRFLAKGAPAYEPRMMWTAAEAIGHIHAAGGVASLAHPVRLNLRTEEQSRRLVQQLMLAGLDAIEVYHSEHDWRMTRCLRRLAKELDLAITGGSDFHGALKPGVMMGRGRGRLRVPAFVWDKLKGRAALSARPAVAGSAV